jgi:hypothetical protein
MSVLYIFEDKDGNQVACETVNSYNEFTERGLTRVASLDPASYLMYQINHNGMRVEK